MGVLPNLTAGRVTWGCGSTVDKVLRRLVRPIDQTGLCVGYTLSMQLLETWEGFSASATLTRLNSNCLSIPFEMRELLKVELRLVSKHSVVSTSDICCVLQVPMTNRSFNHADPVELLHEIVRDIMKV